VNLFYLTATVAPETPSGFMDRIGKVSAMTALIFFPLSSRLAAQLSNPFDMGM